MPVLHESPRVTISYRLDTQGRIEWVDAAVRERVRINVVIAGERATTFDVDLDPGNYEHRIPAGRRVMPEGVSIMVAESRR